MAWFKVMIKGENFFASIDGKEALVGFFLTRHVQADSAEDASLAVLQQIRGDSAQHFLVHPDAPTRPTLSVEEASMVDGADVADIDPGYVFYPIDDAHG